MSKPADAPAEGSAKSGPPPARAWWRTAPGFQPTVVMLRGAATDAQKSQLPQMAAALAYRTIFGLVPVSVVALVVLRVFTTNADIEDLIGRALDYSGLSAIVVNESNAGESDNAKGAFAWPGQPRVGPPAPVEEAGLGPPASPPAAEAGAEAAGEPDNGAPSSAGAATVPPKATASARLSEWIAELVRHAGTINMKAVSLVGLLMLIYAAITMLAEVERAFNQIYRVPRGRSWVRRVMQYWTLLTLGTLFLFATFYVGQRFSTWVVPLAESWGFAVTGATPIRAIGFLITVTISTALFLLAYTTVPNTRVKFWPALAGAFVGAVAWETCKWAFTWYAANTSGYTTLYGSIALVPLFMLWVYFTWLIVLVGLQVSYQLQHVRQGTLAVPEIRAEPTIVDPAAALLVVASVARAFASGKPVQEPALAAQTGLAPSIVEQLLRRLVERGLVHRVHLGEDKTGYTLGRPPESISAAEVLGVGYEMAGATPGEVGAQGSGGERVAGALAAVVARLRLAHVAAAGSETIASLVGALAAGIAGAGKAPAPPPPSSQTKASDGAGATGPAKRADTYPEADEPDRLRGLEKGTVRRG